MGVFVVLNQGRAVASVGVDVPEHRGKEQSGSPETRRRLSPGRLPDRLSPVTAFTGL